MASAGSCIWWLVLVKPEPSLEQVPQAPPDPILGISEAFKASTSPDKLNLGVGAYRTEELKPYVLDVVKKVLPATDMGAPYMAAWACTQK